MLKVTANETFDMSTIENDYAKPSQPTFKVPKSGDVHVDRSLDCFLNTNEDKKRFGHYFIDGNELYYRTVVTERGRMELSQNLIAKRIVRNGITMYIGNSSVLGLIGRRSAWGNTSLNRGETLVQRSLSVLIPMIPFNVFSEAKLDLDSMEIIARGEAEQVTRTRRTGKYNKQGKEIIVDETVHFTGASLFSVSGKMFLFDIDRREVQHKIFNAFLVELPAFATSIKEAYAMLKPEAVISVETSKLKVQRQGEFFFIPVSVSEAKRLDKLKGSVKTLVLRTGNNRPNNGKGLQLHQGKAVPDLSWRSSEERDEKTRAQWLKIENLANDSEYFFTGKVEHSGREHAPLILKGWYQAVPNTAQRSFTITGEVD